MLGAYDTVINTSLQSAIVRGSADDIARWRAAVTSRRDFAARFETQPIVNRLTETVMQGGERVLKVDPADAAAEIFGRGVLGLKRGLARDLRVMKSELSPQSWNAIRDEATLNLFAAADGTFEVGSQFAKRLDLLKRDGAGTMAQLFTGEERALLDRMARTAKLVNRQPKMGVNMNPSGTATVNAIVAKARTIGGPVGSAVAAQATHWARNAQTRLTVAEVSPYFRGVLQRRSTQSPRAFVATGTQTQREGEESRQMPEVSGSR